MLWKDCRASCYMRKFLRKWTQLSISCIPASLCHNLTSLLLGRTVTVFFTASFLSSYMKGWKLNRMFVIQCAWAAIKLPSRTLWRTMKAWHGHQLKSSLWKICSADQPLLLCPVGLSSLSWPSFLFFFLHKCFQHCVTNSGATEHLWIPQTESLIILSRPPSRLPPPIFAPFLSFSWGTWLMCTLPLVVFLIANTPAQSAQCTNTHPSMRTHTPAPVCVWKVQTKGI